MPNRANNSNSNSNSFTGATVASAMQGQAPETAASALEGETANVVGPPAGVVVGQPAKDPRVREGFVPLDQPQGGFDGSIPVHQGNRHLVIGAPARSTAPVASASEQAQRPEDGDPVVGGPGTENPNVGITRTVGHPESAAEPIRQVGSTVILPETSADESAKETVTGLPRPRTDADADPHEVTDPGFQGFDRINPGPVSVPPDRAIEHRGSVNEPRVVGVQSVGEPPVRVIGSQSSEAAMIDGGMSAADAQRESQHPTGPVSETAEAVESSQSHEGEKRGHLPEGFPGLAALEAAGEATYAKVRKRIENGTLTEISGIGTATAAQIEAAM